MLVKLENICKSFGEHQVLKDIDMQINEGEFLVVMKKAVQENQHYIISLVCWISLQVKKVYINDEEIIYKNKRLHIIHY